MSKSNQHKPGDTFHHDNLGEVLVVMFFGANVKEACAVDGDQNGFDAIDDARGLYFVPALPNQAELLRA